MISRKKGFTLVEMSLSIAFIGILSIIVVVVIINTISSYRRGITLNQLNTVGMDLVDDIRASIRRAPGFNVDEVCGATDASCKANGGISYVYKDLKDGDATAGGVFCTGSYSYLWNAGDYLKEPDRSKISLKYKKGAASAQKNGFRLLKVEDPNRLVCEKVRTDSFDIDISSQPIENDPVELLSSEGNSLAVYGLESSAPISGGADNSFYYVSLTLGTLDGGIINSSSCAAPESEEAEENFDYCAINKFNFAAQARGGLNG